MCSRCGREIEKNKGGLITAKWPSGKLQGDYRLCAICFSGVGAFLANHLEGLGIILKHEENNKRIEKILGRIDEKNIKEN